VHSEESRIIRIQPVQIGRVGCRGRPRKTVNRNWLEDAMSARRKISLRALADAIGIHRNTLRNYMRMYGVYTRFSEISDCDLDILIQHFKFKITSPHQAFVMPWLFSNGMVFVSRNSVFECQCAVLMDLAKLCEITKQLIVAPMKYHGLTIFGIQMGITSSSVGELLFMGLLMDFAVQYVHFSNVET